MPRSPSTTPARWRRARTCSRPSTARNLLRYGGLRPDRDWVQIDPALAYGLTEYLRFLDVAGEAGWSRRRFIPHGGHQLALNIAAGLQLGGSESYPGVFQPYGGFADDDPGRRRLRAPAARSPASAWSSARDVRRDAQAIGARMSQTTSYQAAELEALIAAALIASNTSEANARSVARALAQAEIDGQKGHGLSRVPIYAAQARAGKVDGHATPSVRQTRPGSLMIDVANGFAFPAVDLAVERLPPGGAAGIAAAGFVRSHHFGVVGRHVERLAEAGLVALAFGNTPKAMAPWGGTRSRCSAPTRWPSPRRSGAGRRSSSIWR